MKIKVITRHSPSNYGSILQSFATCAILHRLGHSSEIIDYKRFDDRGLRKVWTEAKSKNNNIFKRIVYTLIRYPIEKYAECRFDRIRNQILPLTSTCRSHSQLERLDADVFMTGSDQVWGPMVNGCSDSAYFLDFVKKGKRVSYAASFGKTSFEEEITNKYKQLLFAYDKIAVREDSAVSLIQSWGLSNCVGQVLDPTLLLTGDEWRKWTGLTNNSSNGGYVLIYQLHNDPNLSAYAEKLSKTAGLELIRVNPFFHQVFRKGKFICCPDVKDFLKLIDGATLIVTDSFHGTCFAINFNKQFVEILPNNATGTRNQSILKLTKLSNRIVTNFSDFSLLYHPIDYSLVNEILITEREKSLSIMKQLIS